LEPPSSRSIRSSNANMADPEVATKAPESDATEETTASLISGDTPAQKGASLGVRGNLVYQQLILTILRNTA
jgi:hypothetical protein